MELPKDFGIQGQWIPVTPAKPIPIKRPAPPISGPSWMDSVDGNGVSGIPWSVPNHGQMAALASASQGQIDGRASGELRALVFNSDRVAAQVPSYRRLLAINDPAIASKMNLAPFMVARIGGGAGGVGGSQEMNAESSNRNQLLLNGKILFPMNRENGGTRLLPLLAPKPQYRSGFPLFPNLNSLPENNNMASRVVGEAMPSPATPATMEKNQRERIQDRLPREIIDLVGETTSYQDLLRTEFGKLPQSIADNPVEQCFSNQVESSQIVTSQHQEGEGNVVVNSAEGVTVQQGERENQGIDLNKTPAQKPKRKKHRPKVIREGKPARTPKTATPKPTKTTENPSGKRKYVRKKKDASQQETPINPQETPSSAALGEIVHQDCRSRSKSVRRSLNFDLEDSQAVDRLSGSASMMFRQNVLETQGRETHAVAETVATSRTTPDAHCSRGQGSMAVENSIGCGVGFDLNGLTNQCGNENVRIPQTPNQPPQPSRQEIMRSKWQKDFERMLNKMSPSQQPPARREGGNLKKLARMMNCQNIPGNHERNLIDVQGQAASNSNSNLLQQGAKRVYNLVDNAQVLANMSIMQANNGAGKVTGNYNASSIDPCSPDIHKRRRIENGQKELTPNAYSTSACTPPSGWRSVSTMQNTSTLYTFADAQRLMALEKRQSPKHMLEFNQVERVTNGGQVQDHGLIPTPTNLASNYKMDCNQPPTPEKAPGISIGQETEIYGPKARVEVLTAKQMKSKARRQRKKEPDPLVNSIPTNANQMGHVAAACQIGSSPTSESTQQRSRAAHLGASPPQDSHTSSSYKASAYRGFQSGPVVAYGGPIDEIVRKLSLLNINVSHEEVAVQPQNAIVPYVGGNGTMVPFESPFRLTKKRKPRPKVDLDTESNRVWKLLMGKEEGEEGTDIDKEKWWEEERRVFRGRADSFIARMHLIQGDRRFSLWKGSVVDSVIGVFLTQNVSDHLSSSAFMCMAARFPPQSKENAKTADGETISRSIVINDTTRCQGEISQPEFCGQSSVGINKSEKMDNKETANSNESLESNNGGGSIDYSKESSLDFHEIELRIGQESPDSNLCTAVTVTSCTSAVEGDDRKSPEDVVSSQNSVISSQNSTECPGQIIDESKLSPLLNFEADELLSGGTGNCFSSFRELLEMADGRVLNDLKSTGNEWISSEHGSRIDRTAALRIDKSPSVPNGPAYLNGAGPSIHTSNSHLHAVQHDIPSSSCAPSSSYCYQNFSSSRFVGMEKADFIINERNQSYLPLSGFGLHETNKNETLCKQYVSCTGSSTNVMDQNELLIANIAPRVDSFGPINKNPAQPISSSGIGVRPLQSERNSYCQSEASSKKIASGICFNQQDWNAVMFQNREGEAELQIERTWKVVETQAEIQNGSTLQTCSHSQNDSIRNNLVAGGAAESNLINEASASEKASVETLNNASKAKKVKAETEKKKTFDWDSLRKQVCQNGAKRERGRDRMDSLDYEALRNADVSEISNTIRERGMNNMLAERIKDFLNRLVRDHGSIDLEWLRDIPPDKAKDYLLSIRGLGLKSVECVRLLTLHHLAFPVDTNVGRICVRLGWVPLQPLPESLQLHLLEMYPVLETIQKYLWPRLCKLDQPTLYELHYQLITFGKVFCTKSKPNCNACPMRGECKHFASAFASARLALPGPEEKHLVPSEVPLSSERSHGLFSNQMPLPQLEGSTPSQEQTVPRNYEPIIEEPATPESECIETSEIDIEDAFYNDPDEIPTIKLNFEEFTQNLQNYMQENNMGLQDGDMSKALVAITPEAASIPMPKLKNVSRLRTEHLVYELPDSHPLLEGLDKREPDDPCPYLLAIWTPGNNILDYGETAQSIEPPTACCSYQDTGKLCDKSTCFSCNSIREAQAQMVRGTLLIPCRTANRGSFPLNGTYFQVNEVFADHDSSRNPIDVPRDWIWNLHRRTVYFGTSIPSIFKGLTTEGIQHCFWRGFVCVRGFDRTSRAPRPLFARLHFPASKVTRNKRTTAGAARKEE